MQDVGFEEFKTVAERIGEELSAVTMTQIDQLVQAGWAEAMIFQVILFELQKSTLATITLSARNALKKGDQAKAKELMLRLCADTDGKNRKGCLAFLKAHAAGEVGA